MAAKLFGCLALVGALVAGPPLSAPARATWSTFTTMGKTVVTSNVACTGLAPGNAVCVGIGATSNVLVNLYNGGSGAWTGWKTYASTSSTKFGLAISDPGCSQAVDVSGTYYVVCGFRDTKMQLEPFYIASGTSTTLSVFPPVKLGLGSAPSCVALSGVQVLCAGQSTTGTLVGAVMNGSSWSTATWTALPAAYLTSPVESSVSCMQAGYSAGQAVCAWATVANAGAADLFDGASTSWQGQVNLGGDLSNPPVCTGLGSASESGGGYCFATGTVSDVYSNLYSGAGWASSSWGGWSGLGGQAHSYSCADYIYNTNYVGIACGAISISDSAFYTSVYGTGWTGWTEQFGGLTVAPTFVRSPTCFVLSTHVSPVSVTCVVVKSDGQTVSTTGP